MNGGRRKIGDRVQDNFDDHWIENENGCWIWQLNCDGCGYGMLNVGAGKKMRAHRWTFQRKHGKLAKGIIIRHKCDTPACVNPEHLEEGTIHDNVMDMCDRGRHWNTKGEKNPSVKLTEIQVIEIRYLAAAGSPRKSIAKYYGIKRSQLGNVVTGKSWAHIPL